MSLNALSEYIFYSRYSQYNENHQRKETWAESVRRIFDMHRQKYADIMTPELSALIDRAEKAQRKKRVLASQRSLQFAIEPILKHELKMYNCLTTYIDRKHVFGEVFYSLLCGCGVGFSVQKQHVSKLPDVRIPNGDEVFYTVEDSIEGWANAIQALMASYYVNVDWPEFSQYANKRIIFDFSAIRPEGASIAGRFKAPGPDGLDHAITKIKCVLNNRIVSREFSGKMRPIDAYDIIMHISDAVLSGGVRRCLPGNYEVKMSDGTFKSITDLKVGECVIYAGKEYPITNVFDNGVQELIKINTSRGYHISTPSHRWLVLDSISKELCWITSSEIETDPARYAFVSDADDSVLEIKDQNALPSKYNLTPIESTVRVSAEITYDIEVDEVHAFTARSPSGLESVSHNSATICLFSYDDDEMTKAKTGKWYVENPQRGRSNNSVMLLKSEITPEQFGELMKSTREFGEPGFVWVDDLDIAYNPCVTGDADLMVQIGKTIAVKNMSEIVELFSRGKEIDVASYNTESNQVEFKRITDAAMTRQNAEIIELTLKSFTDGPVIYNTLRCTPDHKIYTTNRGYVEAQDLLPTDRIKVFNEDPHDSQVHSMIDLENEDVYDITVEDNHNFFANNILVHNCAEIGMVPRTESGISGWQGCNLTEINGKYCDNAESFYDACECASIIGTLQAGYTDFKYIDSVSKEIFERESLLGCSITGWMDQPEILFNPEIQREGAKRVLDMNEYVSGILGIRPCARGTTVKPSGSASALLGSASGIHPHHSKRYIRRVQVNRTEEIGQIYQNVNPDAVEKSRWSSTNTDNMISFLCEVPPGAIVKNQISALDLLEKVNITQRNWIEYGTRVDRCVIPSVRHNVSNTITVRDDEWEEVEKYIYENRKYFAGVSLISLSGDLDYVQAPNSTILTPTELVKEYGDASVFASGLIVDGLHAFDGDLWGACSVVLFNGLDGKPENQKDWVRRVVQFAERYFDNDVKKATYCLKHVSLWKTWCDIKREHKEIDWTEYQFKPSFVAVDTLGAASCVGGKCEIL